MTWQAKSRGGNPGSNPVVDGDVRQDTNDAYSFATPRWDPAGGFQDMTGSAPAEDEVPVPDDAYVASPEGAQDAPHGPGVAGMDSDHTHPTGMSRERNPGSRSDGREHAGNEAGTAGAAEQQGREGKPFKVPGEWRQYAIEAEKKRLTIRPIGISRCRAWAGSDEAIAIDVRLFDKDTVHLLALIGEMPEEKVKALLRLMHDDLRQTIEDAGEGWTEGEDVDIVMPDLDYYFDRRMQVGREWTCYGAFGTGKTWLVEGLVASLTHAVEVVPGFIPRLPPRRVLYLDWDEDRNRAMRRRTKVLKGKGLKPRPGTLRFQPMRGALKNNFAAVAKMVAQFQPHIIVISNRESAIGANEGSDPGDGVMEMHHLLGEFKCGVIYIDHVTGEDVSARTVNKPYGSVKKMNVDRGAMHIALQHKEQDYIEVALDENKPDSHQFGSEKHAIGIRFSPDSVTYEACAYRSRRGQSVGASTADGEGNGAGRGQPMVLVEALREGPKDMVELAEILGCDVEYVKQVKYDATKPPYSFDIQWKSGKYRLYEDE